MKKAILALTLFLSATTQAGDSSSTGVTSTARLPVFDVRTWAETWMKVSPENITWGSEIFVPEEGKSGTANRVAHFLTSLKPWQALMAKVTMTEMVIIVFYPVEKK